MFLLRAVADGLVLPQLASVTGLSVAALRRQLAFLEQHGFLTIDEATQPDHAPAVALAERGARMVEVQRFLAGFAPSVWLDAFTLKPHAVHALALRDNGQLVLAGEHAPLNGASNPASNRLVVRLPERTWQYRPFEQANRMRSVLSADALADLISFLHPDAAALAGEEAPHWYCTPGRSERDQALEFLAVEYAAGEFSLDHSQPQGGRATLPAVGLPVLAVTHRFSKSSSLPWRVDVPASQTHYIELASMGPLPVFDGMAIGDARQAKVSIPPACDATQPSGLPAAVLPPGVEAQVEITHLEAACSLDHDLLSRRMHAIDSVVLFSFNRSASTVEAA